MRRGAILPWILAATVFGCNAASTRVIDDAGAQPGSGSGGGTHPTGSGGTTGAGNGGTSGTGNTSGGGGSVATDGPSCGVKTFGLTKVPPDLLIVQDRSGSMAMLPDGTSCRRADMATCQPMTKWPQITAAINQVVMQTEDTIRWGLKFFADDELCGVNDGAVVPIADKNAAAIAAAIAGAMPLSSTPTRAALVSAGAYLATLTDPNPKYILLATDGLPNCGMGQLGFGGQADDSVATIQAVTDVAAKGIPVFVVGIGSIADAQTTLTAMAVAGGVPQAADPKYYPVASTADLVTVLGTIGGMIGSCSFSLGSVPPDPTNVTVTANGTKIPKDTTHTNGWDYGTGQTSIQLFGQTCDDAKAGKLKDVQAIFGCIIP
ncbi:MAG TPA: vWA domain-containing protein [Polyangia bacterium]